MSPRAAPKAPGTSVWEGARYKGTVFRWLSHTCCDQLSCLSFHDFYSSDNSFSKHVQKRKWTCSGGVTAKPHFSCYPLLAAAEVPEVPLAFLLPIAIATSPWAPDSQHHSALSSKGFFLSLQWFHTLLKSSTFWVTQLLSLSFFFLLKPCSQSNLSSARTLAVGDV